MPSDLTLFFVLQLNEKPWGCISMPACGFSQGKPECFVILQRVIVSGALLWIGRIPDSVVDPQKRAERV